MERKRNDDKKKLRDAEKAERKKLRERKQAILTKPELEKKLMPVIHEIVRLIDEDLPCICCGEYAGEKDFMLGGQYDAGHFRSVGSMKYLKFDLRNIHRQRKYCNSKNGLGGNYQQYEKGLIARYGQDLVDWLNGPHESHHYTHDDIRQMILKYRAILKDIKNGGFAKREFYRIELRKLSNDC